MAVLTNGMTRREARYERTLQKKLKEIGDYETIRRFTSKYGNFRTVLGYIIALSLYLRWLKSRRITLNPDELIQDNLRCIYESVPTDVRTKRRHTDLLNEYVNEVMKGGKSDSLRKITAAAVMMFYKRNDSPLFGDFQLAEGKPTRPAPALSAEDIRAVLKALPLAQRLALLFEWQSGVEINRVLGFTWQELNLEETPCQLAIYGRKNHRRPYMTFLGADTIQGLRLWPPQEANLSRRRRLIVRSSDPLNSVL
jgi:integrase